MDDSKFNTNSVSNKVSINRYLVLMIFCFAAAILVGIHGENETRRDNFKASCILKLTDQECDELLNIIDPPVNKEHFT